MLRRIVDAKDNFNVGVERREVKFVEVGANAEMQLVVGCEGGMVASRVLQRPSASVNPEPISCHLPPAGCRGTRRAGRRYWPLAGPSRYPECASRCPSLSLSQPAAKP